MGLVKLVSPCASSDGRTERTASGHRGLTPTRDDRQKTRNHDGECQPHIPCPPKRGALLRWLLHRRSIADPRAGGCTPACHLKAATRKLQRLATLVIHRTGPLSSVAPCHPQLLIAVKGATGYRETTPNHVRQRCTARAIVGCMADTMRCYRRSREANRARDSPGWASRCEQASSSQT